MNSIENGISHSNPPSHARVIESITQFLKDCEDPEFVMQSLHILDVQYPQEKKRLEREIRQRIPRKSDITAESLGIYLTNRAFDQIEAEENRDVNDVQVYQYARPEDKNPMPNSSQILSEIDLRDLPVQPTIEEYAGLGVWDDPIRSAAARKKMSEAKKKNWQDPEYHRKMVESIKRGWETRKAGIRKYDTVVTQSVAGTEIVTFDYSVDKEDRSLWTYALQEGIIDKIIESGKLSEAEIEILTQYFNFKGKVSNISFLLDRFSIVVAQLA